MKTSSFKLSLISFISLWVMACVPEAPAPTPTAPENNDVTYSLNVNVPTYIAARPQASRGVTASKQPTTVDSFAIVDLDPTTGKVNKIHNIKSAADHGNDQWDLVVESNPNAASFVIVHANDNAPDICINCKIPAETVYAPLSSTSITVDAVSTVVSDSIIKAGLNSETFTISEIADLVITTDTLRITLPAMGNGQTLANYLAATDDDIEEAVITEVFNTSGVSLNVQKIMFLTKDKFTGNLGGVAGADQKCQADADEENIRGVFKAAISSTGENMVDRLASHSTGIDIVDNGYVKLLGDGTADLFDGSIGEGIIILSNGNPSFSSGEYWTASTAYGTLSGSTCLDWTTDSSSSDPVQWGVTTDNGSGISYTRWTGNLATCNALLRLMCVEQ